MTAPIEGATVSIDLASLRIAVDPQGVAWLSMNVPGEPLNVINQQLVEDLDRALDRIDTSVSATPASIRSLVITSAKPGAFLAGADLKLIRTATEARQAEEAARRIQTICDRIERLPITTVAVIEGPALGGGLEIALACDYRVAAQSTKRELGLVEVQLGLLPAGGGTQRLPKLVGLPLALTLILSSRCLDTRRAKRARLIDDAAHPAVLNQAALRWAAKPKRSERPKRSFNDRILDSLGFARNFVFRQAEGGIRKKQSDRYPAPFLALESIRTGLDHGVNAGLAAEARNFGSLAVSTKTRNLIDLFLDSNDLKREQSETMMAPAPKRVGLVGAGLMGAGIGQATAISGMAVRVKEITPDAVAAGLRRIDRLVRQAQRSRLIARYTAGEVRSRVSGSDAFTGFGRVDLVIEAALEDIELKRGIIAQLESEANTKAIIGTNTSALPIGDIAAGAKRPERVVGIHFFSPVHKMPLVEVVRGPKTGDTAVGVAVAYGRKLGKHVVVVNDGPGFFTTRVLGFMMSEAIRLFEEGAGIEAIDRALVTFGFPMGPMALMDEVGLDVAVHVADTLAQAFPSRLSPSNLMTAIATPDRKGKHGGKGFYLYEKKKKTPDPDLARLPGRGHATLSSAQMIERLSLIFVNEAARCLDERIIAGGRDGDLASIFGVGFPPFLGGPFRYADLAGVDFVVERLERLASEHGPRFEPAACLQQAAKQGTRLRPTEYPLGAAPARGPSGELIGLA
jgi:3-hydroxyacyl-CoA dehydrogenase/enoyl-CoA hydratase/3-hydroxybutyryl-CoA epimerase